LQWKGLSGRGREGTGEDWTGLAYLALYKKERRGTDGMGKERIEGKGMVMALYNTERRGMERSG